MKNLDEKKRRLSGHRLLNIAKITVVVVSLICLFASLSPQMNKLREESRVFDVELASRQCDRMYSNSPSMANKCFWERTEKINRRVDMQETIFLILGLALPIVFFSGIWLYKYIFPNE